MKNKIVFLAFCLLIVHGGYGFLSHAENAVGQALHRKPRSSIKWPEGCAFYAIDDEHALERACAAALSSITDWPKSPDDCRYDYHRDFVLDPEGIGAPPFEFLPLSPGKFLIQMDCGAAAYNFRNIYVLYDETQIPATARLLRFPYYAYTADSADVPDLTWVTPLSGRAFNRYRRELIVHAKFRGMGDCGIFARYVFPKDEPVLREMRVKTHCDGRLPYAVLSNDPPSPRGWSTVSVQ